MAVLTGFICLRIGASGGFLCSTVMNLWIPKMLKIWVAEQLLDSQKGLGSTELVFVLDHYFFVGALYALGSVYSTKSSVILFCHKYLTYRLTCSHQASHAQAKLTVPSQSTEWFTGMEPRINNHKSRNNLQKKKLGNTVLCNADPVPAC
jgi:hypothetical protein